MQLLLDIAETHFLMQDSICVLDIPYLLRDLLLSSIK